MQPPPKEAKERLKQFPLKDDPLTELSVRQMLSVDIEWEADFGSTDNEKQTLLSSQADTANR